MRSRAESLPDLAPKSGRAAIVFHVVVADKRKMRHVEPAADLIEELKLFLGGVLDVVTDELNKVGSYRAYSHRRQRDGPREHCQGPAPSDAGLPERR